MVRENKNPEQGPLEEESLRFLLGEEIRSFHNDNFECSKEEYQIFTEVFYGKNACNTAKSRTDAGMVKYVSDQNSQSRALVSLNSGNPVPTCQPSLKDLYGRVHMGRFKKIMADGSRSSHLQEDFCGQLESDVCNLNSKQLALSSVGPSNLQMKERGCCLSDISNESVLIKSSKDVSKTNIAALDHMPQPTPYRIVESFSQGIISSCYFPSHYDERDGPNNADDNSPSRSNGGNDLIGDMKLDDEGKATTALVFWESSASKHLIENEPSALTMNNESKFFDTDVAKSSLALVRELPNRLRSHAHNLLLDAGWKIEGRIRRDRSKLYSIFKTPGEGVVIYSLIKAWRICGEWLAAGNINSSQEESSRQWLQIDGFWCDLAAVLSYIEKEVQDPKCIPSLLRRWHLLDPFMSVVFIDKKIGALREGKAVKVVRGRSVDLHLNRNSSLTEKAGLSSENQPAKVTSYSVSRLSHCLHPCKSSNIRASVSSYMNHATVDEGFLTAVKPEVTETSCNRKLGCKNIPEFHTQVPHDLKEKHGSGRLHRKLSFGGEAKKRSLKSLARSLGNGSNFDRKMQNKKHMVSLDCSKQKSTSTGVPSVIRKSFTLSNTASEPSVPLILGTQKSQLESSKQDLKSVVAASTCKSFNHEVQKGVGASDSCRSLPIESQLYKEAASGQRTSNLYPKGHTVSFRKSKKCGKGVPCNGKTYATCHTLREAEQLEIQSSSVFHGSNNAVVLCLASDVKITAKNHSAYKEKNNVLEEGLNEKIVESAIALGKSASFSVESQTSDHLAEGEKVQFLYTQQAVSGDQMDAASEGATYQDTRSSVVRSKHLKGESADATEASKSGPEQSSATVPGSKKLSKRSRKISDIAAKKLQHKDMKSTQPSEKYEGEIVPELDDKMSDNFDFPVFQGVGNILKVGTVSCSSMTSENHEVPDRIANKMLGSVETSSAVTEISTAEKNKHEAPRTRSVKVNRTCKKRKQQDVKSESSLLNLGKDQEDRGEYQNNENKCQGENAISLEATSISSLQHIKTKKYPTIGSKSKMPVAACQKKSLVRPQSENGTLEASFLSEQKSPESQTNQRTAKRNNSGSQKENCRKRQRGEDIDDDDLLVVVIIKTKDQTSNSTHSSCNAKMSQSKGCRKLKSRKGSCKLLLRTPGKGGTQSMSGARTPLAWLLNSGVVPLNAAVQYCNPKNNAILKDGRVTREGILCQCCSKILSVSAFKCHAGHKLTQSSLNLFLESGKSYTLCQLQAWSNEYKARKDGRQVAKVEEMDQNDDTCGLCGDGGELICCDNCPSTFHQSCLHSQVIPEGSWYCPNCTCKICGDTIAAEVPLGSFIMLECSQCEQKYHDICLKKKGSSNDRSVSDTWLCGGYCEKVYFGLRSRVGVINSIDDGFSWMILRCNHSDQKVQSAQKIALTAECNSKLAVALTIMEECFLPMVDPRTGINLIPQVLYSWGSNFPRLNYRGFYTVILEKDDKIISVATIRVHGITVAEMPLIATCSEHRRQGMCRRLMGAIEEMLRSFKVQTLVLSAIPDLIDTWTSGFGFKPIDDDEKRQLSTINLMLFPGTALLKKSLGEAFEMRKPEDETFSSSREVLNHQVDLFDRRTEFMTPQEPGRGGSLTAGINLIVGTTSRFCTDLEISGKENCRQQNLPASSSETLTIVANNEPDYPMVAVSGELNILGSDLLSDPRSSMAYKEFRDVECASSGHIGITTEQRMVDGSRNKKLITQPSGGDKTGDVKTSENSEGKNNSDILERIDSLNPSNVSVTEIDDASAPTDVSAQYKELLSSRTIRGIPSEEVHNITDFGVDSVNGKRDGNSSTLACINEVSDTRKLDVESTKVILDPVVIPVPITKCSRVPPIFSESNFGEKASGICLSVMCENKGKKGPYYTCCENVQDRDTLKMKVGFVPQRGGIVDNAKTGNLSQRTVSNHGETPLEEVERSLRDLSLCLREEFVGAQKQSQGICDLV